jgi:hypothetical protein
MDDLEQQPRRIWWARPRKLCGLERPGGGGRSHRPERRATEIAYLKARRVRLFVSTSPTRHNLEAYEEAGLAWHHVPVATTADGAAALDELVALLRTETSRPGAVAVHGNRWTDFVAAVCAAHLHDVRDVPVVEALARASQAGLTVTAEACALVGVELGEVEEMLRAAAA